MLSSSYCCKKYQFFIGEEAKRVFADAQAMLKKVINENLLQAHAEVAFYPANSCGDDIKLFDDLQQKNHIATLYGLRQQVRKCLKISLSGDKLDWTMYVVTDKKQIDVQ